MNKENYLLITCLIILIISVVLTFTNFIRFKFGLEIEGGTILYYDADISKVAKEEIESTLSAVKDLIERRINYLGIAEINVSYSKNGRIIVEIPNIKDPELAKKTIGETPILEFKVPLEVGTSTVFVPSPLTGKYLKTANVEIHPQTGLPIVSLEFDNEGTKIFAELTKKYIGKPIAIYLDNNLISSPIVREEISSGKAIIEGNFSLEEARDLASKLKQGALPVALKLVGSSVVNPKLGHESLKKVTIGGIYGFLLILIFMLVFYRIHGIIANIALIFYLFFNLLLYKLLGVALSLSGIVGFILSIGMAVDANILIAERIKEEKTRMKIRDAILEGFNRAWPSIRDSNISTIISCILMYIIATSFVKGFAITLGLGVLISMLTAVFLTKILTLKILK